MTGPAIMHWLEARTLAIVRHRIGIRAATATLDSAWRQDLHCDAMDRLECAHALEEAFGVTFSDADIEQAETIADYAATVRQQVTALAAEIEAGAAA